MRLTSFRTRLLVAIFGCSATAIIAGGIFTYEMVRRHLYEEFDHFLRDKVRFHKASCVQEGEHFSFKLPENDRYPIYDPNDPEFFQFRFLDGRDIFHSKSIPEGAHGLPLLGLGGEKPEARDFVLPNGHPGRALGVTFIPTERGAGDPEVELSLVVAHQRGDLVGALKRLRELIYLSGIVAALLLLGATMIIVRQLLRPLASLTQQIEVAPVGEEAGAFSLIAAPQELHPVVERLNVLMGRVQAALENERQFTSNAAHELRNPLAGLRSQVELALGGTRDPERDEEALANILEIQRQMEGMVENLLVLARLDAGRETIVPEQVEVTILTKRAWKPYFDRAAERGIRLRWDIESGIAPILSSARLLEILLDNLFDNSTTYTPKGGQIRVSLKGRGDQIDLVISNTNPGVASGRSGRRIQTLPPRQSNIGRGAPACRYWFVPMPQDCRDLWGNRRRVCGRRGIPDLPLAPDPSAHFSEKRLSRFEFVHVHPLGCGHRKMNSEASKPYWSTQ